MTPEERREAAWQRVTTTIRAALDAAVIELAPPAVPIGKCLEPITLDGFMLYCHQSELHRGDHVAVTPSVDHRVTWPNTGRSWANHSLDTAGVCSTCHSRMCRATEL